MTCTEERIQRRNFKVLPLIYGNKLCMRVDCLYLSANLYKKLIVAKKSKTLFISAPITAMKKARSALFDRYVSTPDAVSILFSVLPTIHVILKSENDQHACHIADICGGSNDQIALKVTSEGLSCITNDCNPLVKDVNFKFDAADPSFCMKLINGIGNHDIIRCVITSPPYSQIIPILRNALALATHYVIMKLPLSFMIVGPFQEDRRCFWAEFPQDCIVPLSRSVACRGREVKCDEAWYIWCVNDTPKPTKAFIYAM